MMMMMMMMKNTINMSKSFLSVIIDLPKLRKIDGNVNNFFYYTKISVQSNNKVPVLNIIIIDMPALKQLFFKKGCLVNIQLPNNLDSSM